MPAKSVYIVLGTKHGEFTDSKTNSTVPFHQIALDCGKYLKVFKVKSQQSDKLDLLAPGMELSDLDGFTVDQYFIFN